MKNLKLILAILILLSGSILAKNNANIDGEIGNPKYAEDLDNLQHTIREIKIKRQGAGAIDLNDDVNLSKRDIQFAGEELKKNIWRYRNHRSYRSGSASRRLFI